MTGSYGNFIFNFFEELPCCFPYWLHHFTLPPTVHDGSNFFTSLLTLFSNFLIVATLMGVSLYIIVVLIHISLMIGDIEHLLMYLLVICISSLEECLFKSFDQFFFFYQSIVALQYCVCLYFTAK